MKGLTPWPTRLPVRKKSTKAWTKNIWQVPDPDTPCIRHRLIIQAKDLGGGTHQSKGPR